VALFITCISSILIMLALSRINNSKRLNDPESIFVDLGDQIGVRTTTDSRFFKFPFKKIPKNKIVKIQQASCVSLFYKSGNAIDIVVTNGEVEQVVAKAKQLLPSAEVVIIAN
jgi:hypothetical protein